MPNAGKYEWLPPRTGSYLYNGSRLPYVRYTTRSHWIIVYYYLFKIVQEFWLAKRSGWIRQIYLVKHIYDIMCIENSLYNIMT
jgi:hypothetical protein